MDDKTKLELLTAMLRTMVPHAWVDYYTAQYYCDGKFYNVTFNATHEVITDIAVLDFS